MSWALLHLHGVGTAVHTERWYHALVGSLGEQGLTLPALGSPRLIVPTYDDLLKAETDHRAEEPARTPRFTGTTAELLALRAHWARSQASAVRGLPQYAARGFNGVGATLDPTTNALLKSANKDFADARRYLADPQLRHAVLHRVLADLGEQQDLVIVAHSLGSVVAIDLLHHLPANVRVRRLVTIGSPAGTQGFHKSGPERLLEAKNFPYHRVDSWINVFSPWDPITFGRGLSGLFPAAADVRIELPRWEHAAHAYLSHPVTARVIAEALQPVVPGVATEDPRALDEALDREENLALDHLVFATLVRERIEDRSERRTRFGLALTDVAAEVGRHLVQVRREAGRSVPRRLEAVSRGDLTALRLTTRPLDEQLLLAVVAATNNPIAPYEIAAAKETEAAVSDLWSAWGHAGAESEKLARALREAGKVFDPSGGWRWVALGAAGLALIALPPLGIAVGGAGVAGGAALTTGLAAFGPGGMVGGMALAGGLIGVGSASVAVSVRLPGRMSADQLQTQLVRYLAFARAHQLLDLPGAPLDAWHLISGWYDELSAEVASLALFSDDSSPGLKQARAKQELVRKALAWLTDLGLSARLLED